METETERDHGHAPPPAVRAPARPFFPSARPVGVGAWSRGRAGALIGGLYLVASLLYFWKLVVAGPASVIGRSGDEFLNAYFLGWVPHALAGLHNPLFTPNLNYPNGLNLLFNTSQPFLGLLMAPVTAIGGAVLSFNLLILLSMPVNAGAGYFAARQLVAWRPAAFLAGVVIGFCPYALFASKIGHLQLSFIPVVPLYLVVLLWVLRCQWSPRRAGVAIATLLIIEFFISTEVDVTLLVATVVIGVVSLALLSSARSQFGRLLGTWAVAGPILVIVLAYPLWFMTSGPGSIAGPVQLVAQAYRSDLLSPIIPPDGLAFAPATLVSMSRWFASTPGENLGYVGAPIVVAVLAVTLWLRSERRVLVLSISSLALFILSLGGALAVTGAPHLGRSAQATGGPWLPESLVADLPLLKSLIPSRFAEYYVVLLALVLAIGAEQLRRRWANDSDVKVGIVVWLMVLCVLPLVPSTIDQKPLISLSQTPAYFSSAAFRSLPGDSALILSPYPADPNPIGILWQVESGFAFKMPSGHAKETQGSSHALAYNPWIGYAALSTAGYTLTTISHGVAIDRAPTVRQAVVDQLNAWHIAAVTSTPGQYKNPAQGLSDMIWLLGRPTGRVKGTYFWNAPFRVPAQP